MDEQRIRKIVREELVINKKVDVDEMIGQIDRRVTREVSQTLILNDRSRPFMDDYEKSVVQYEIIEVLTKYEATIREAEDILERVKEELKHARLQSGKTISAKL
ncbi:hypothetical protein [Cohnella algarum]|uniref:hypothetical protein n=1 Tax=Cohnella algarum TaxID=2044859 RepID=UPI0019670EE4|nr:hypothetical protein [Cohnella algarum]MBN2980108.1 hypothetical protein [Cohnella algarum]